MNMTKESAQQFSWEDGIGMLTDVEQALEIRKRVDELGDWLRSKGIPFFMVVVPESESEVKETETAVTRTSQISAIVKKNFDTKDQVLLASLMAAEWGLKNANKLLPQMTMEMISDLIEKGLIPPPPPQA